MFILSIIKSKVNYSMTFKVNYASMSITKQLDDNASNLTSSKTTEIQRS